MFGKHHRLGGLAAIIAAVAALLVPCAQAGAQGQPRAMPSDYAAQTGQQPRAMPSDYGARLDPTGFGMPRAMPSDYAPTASPTGGSAIDWPSAGLGAGLALALVLTAAGITAVVRGSRLVRA